ncbi:MULTISPECIES: branched-chain amino acid ABC transporter permease [Alphaproteobacteria]|uniref:Branched-chain amino acid ABC transporter permease n=2 Tax=Alphaproteobacteria TaxID=28211 RepID=A0A512HMF9_9HYPH|nr:MULTISPECIES: branched-chain amino acid ABC transporter permease [Alphaproteobacteria]GEO86642.1 branched-chain amino acid ABC transporter permease [Ciceribacter naphthalenivorans]GLR23628.1 branched-chain amino acid ABC transporter permease [Ciceribacter naphthalenivorans]GLT06484.1 branched-chain amino acid ABC transporter permease [Sphingomonas psychrolutea]
MTKSHFGRVLALHLGLVALLFGLQFVLPDYHHLAMTRVMVLAVYAMGYNMLFGYTGLLSLGHAMFFAAGLYGAGLTAYYTDWGVPVAFLIGIASGFALSLVIGLISLRTTGVAFMIVTMMFAQVAYLTTTYFTDFTRGEEGLTMPQAARSFDLLGLHVDLTNAAQRYNLALGLLVVALVVIFAVVKGPIGRVLIAIRENEPRTLMLGYDTFRLKLVAVVLSGTISAMAGAAYALLFGYIGATFATIQYSIEPLLFTLLGGAGTILGPLIGTAAMFYMIDIASNYTAAYLLVTGVALVLLVLYFPKGILGTIRERWWPWLP